MTMSRKAKALQFADEEFNIHITGRHVQVTEAMKNYALDKVSKIEKITNRLTDVNVILDIQKLEHRADIIIKVGHTKITGQGISNDMYVSIDMAINRIESQLKKYKNKLQDHHLKPNSFIDMKVNVLRLPKEMAEDEEEFIGENEVKTPEVVKSETRPLKTLTLDEAIMKMELSGDTFLIFKSEEDQRLKVIYRRNDENYGVIEPQC